MQISKIYIIISDKLLSPDKKTSVFNLFDCYNHHFKYLNNKKNWQINYIQNVNIFHQVKMIQNIYYYNRNSHKIVLYYISKYVNILETSFLKFESNSFRF